MNLTQKDLGKSILLGLLFVGVSLSAAIAVQLSRQEGDKLERKLEEIGRNGAAVPVQARKTPMSENELNSYLAFNAKDRIPQGLANPEVTIVGDGRLAGRVLVDLDEFKRHRSPQGMLDPLSYVSGKVPLTAQGVLSTREGRGQFQFTSAHVRGIPMPKPIVQELVSFFSRTPNNPKGFDLDAPFELPAKVREVAIGKGEAVIVQ